MAKNERATLGEIAKDDHGRAMMHTHMAMLLDNPDTVLAQRGRDLKIYSELLRDDQVHSTFQQRRLAVTESEWSVEPASESSQDKAVAEFVKEQLDGINFDDLTNKMLYAVFYGYSVAEVIWKRDGNRVGIDAIKVRERARFRYDTDDNLRLITIANPMGEIMPARKFWQFSTGSNHDDNLYGQGLGHYLYWPVFFKRNDIKFWLVFLEKFGSPTAVTKLPGGQIDDPAAVTKAKQVLSAIQNDSGVVAPESMIIELLEASRSGTADYSALVDRMDAAISKVTLSQTMTTDDGSSRSQAEVHEGVAGSVTTSDAKAINASFNDQVVRWLTEWNFPGATPPKVHRNTEPAEDLVLRAERDTKIIDLGYEPSQDYIDETYGIGWTKKEIAPLPPASGLGSMGPEFNELSALAMKRVGHRSDQESLVDAASYLSTKYKDIYGDRINKIIGYLEETNDVETFKKNLDTMFAEAPSQDAIDTMQSATWVARLMGLLRGDR